MPTPGVLCINPPALCGSGRQIIFPLSPPGGPGGSAPRPSARTYCGGSWGQRLPAGSWAHTVYLGAWLPIQLFGFFKSGLTYLTFKTACQLPPIRDPALVLGAWGSKTWAARAHSHKSDVEMFDCLIIGCSHRAVPLFIRRRRH